MKTIGYLRVSTDHQDLEKQRHLLLEYAYKERIQIDEFIEIEISSRKNRTERRIDELFNKLQKGDLLVTAELSRVGRNMLETLNIVNELSEKGILLKFVRQPELNTLGANGKLIMAIFSYFAEVEREYISTRTRQGLEAAKAAGVILGRPLGSKNKRGLILDPFKQQIEEYINLGLAVTSIRKIVNNQLDKPVSYNTFINYTIGLRKTE